jgi:hypothetical protein
MPQTLIIVFLPCAIIIFLAVVADVEVEIVGRLVGQYELVTFEEVCAVDARWVTGGACVWVGGVCWDSVSWV